MGEFYKVVTWHDTLLTADPDACLITHCRPELHTRQFGVIAYISSYRADSCFLMTNAVTERPIELAPKQAFGKIICVGITPHEAGTASFYSASSGGWLCAVPAAQENGVGAVFCDRSWILTHEQFSLQTIAPIFVSADLVTAAANIDQLLAEDIVPNNLAGWLSQPGFLDALGAVSQVPGQTSPLKIAQMIIGDADCVNALAAVCPEDFFACRALPAFHRYLTSSQSSLVDPSRDFGDRQPARRWTFWRKAPPPPEPVLPLFETLGVELDSLAGYAFDERPRSLPHALNTVARAAVQPSRDICAVATVRNEGLSLLDWIAYHQAIGISAFFIYSNDNDDGSDALLEALARHGIIKWFKNNVAVGGNAQWKAYGHAFSLMPDVLDYRWALVIDLDEFLGFNHAIFNSIQEFLRWHETREVDAISLNWVMHGSCSEVHWRDEFVARRFHALAESGVNPHVKSLFRPNRFTYSLPHVPVTFTTERRVYRSANGEIHSGTAEHGLSLSARPAADFAWISHFFFKSADEFLLKASRNRGDHPTTTGLAATNISDEFVQWFVAQFYRTAPEAYSILPCAPDFSSRLAMLRNLPDVDKAYRAVVATFQARVADIVPRLEEAPGIRRAGAAGNALVEILRT